MHNDRHAAVIVVQGLPQVRVVGFYSIRKGLGQAIHPPGEYHPVVRGIKLVPAKLSSILARLVKLPLCYYRKQQKQDESHPAFERKNI